MSKQGQILTFTQDKLDSMITDYHWMVNAIKEMRAEMVVGAKTAQYNIEATLSKAVGGVGDPIMQEAIIRSKNIKRVAKYEKKLLEVQKLLDKVIQVKVSSLGIYKILIIRERQTDDRPAFGRLVRSATNMAGPYFLRD